MDANVVQFPTKLKPLFQPFRFKVLRGGRGSTKSWSIARALLLIGTQRKLQVLCAREFQSSMRDSVHKLLSTQIERMGLSTLYDVQTDAIYGPRGTCFVFVGLSDKTAENLKSFEDFDVCWVEEARVVTHRSWNILRPTIRKDGSEIWVSFNPELDTDPVWQMFVEDPPENCFSVEMNWRDNPWWNDVLEAERRDAERKLPKIDYENIWEGKTRPTVEGAIYAEELAKMYAEGRVGLYPYDPRLLVYPVFDIGWNDSMAIGMYQRVASQLRKVNYLENSKKTYAWYSAELAKLPYNWGRLFLPHDGGYKNVQTGQSGQEALQELGWDVMVLPKIDPKEGIRSARMQLATTYVHLPDKVCKQEIEDGSYRGNARWMECMKRYRRSIPKTTMEPAEPVHDQYSHGADEWRYAVQAAPMMDNNVYDLPPRRRRASFMAA